MTKSNCRSNGIDEKEEKEKRAIESAKYLPLYKAALEGDWKSAKRILDNDEYAVTAEITWARQTVLHVAASAGHDAMEIVERLLSEERVSVESLALRDDFGHTALIYAAGIGNTEAVKLLVKKNPELPQIRNKKHNTPLHQAAKYGHKETFCYLLSVTRDEEPSPFTGESGVWLLNLLIVADFYGTLTEQRSSASSFSTPSMPSLYDCAMSAS